MTAGGRKTSWRARLATAAAALAIAAASAGPISAETIRNAFAAAYRNSHLLDQNRALVRVRDEDVVRASAALRPILNFIASANYRDPTTLTDSFTTTLSLTLDLLVYDFGASRARIEAAKETVLAVREQLRGIENQVLLDAATAYLNLRRDMQRVEVSESNVRLIMQELRAAKDRFEVGEVTRTDVSQAEARLAQARSNLAAARGQFEISRAVYEAAIGHKPGTVSLPASLPALPKSLADAKARARAHSPSIGAVQHNVRANELLLAAAEAGRKPQVALGAQLAHNSSSGDSTSIGLQMTMPIYQGGQLSSAIRQARANVEGARAQLLQAAVTSDQSVANAWANLRIARAQVEASDRQIEAARLAFEGVREEAALGARTTLDVLNAEQDLLDARLARINAESQAYQAAYALLAAMGTLTAKDLGLPVEIYDPASNYRAVTGTAVQSTRGARLDRVMKRAGKY